jgi:hypothetical protein
VPRKQYTKISEKIRIDYKSRVWRFAGENTRLVPFSPAVIVLSCSYRDQLWRIAFYFGDLIKP